jgi:membrane-associated phospholipid phosphatase
VNYSTLRRSLQPVDSIIILFGCFLSVVNLVFLDSSARWLVPVNILVCAGIITLAWLRPKSKNRLLNFIHDWYPVIMIFLSFKEMYVVIQAFGRKDFDAEFIAIDRWMFGTDPTVWLSQYSFPLLTEILQIAYMSYYFLMLAIGYELFVRRDQRNFSFIMFTFLYGFYLSYLGYLSFPAVGPRFTLHDFDAMNTELPGLLLTNLFRDIINAGESIPKGVPNPIALAQRDVFPSGHTQMTLIAMYFASMFKLRSRRYIYVSGILLIFSTVYLRYHYVIDVIGGMAFMLLTIWTAPILFKLLGVSNPSGALKPDR